MGRLWTKLRWGGTDSVWFVCTMYGSPSNTHSPSCSPGRRPRVTYSSVEGVSGGTSTSSVDLPSPCVPGCVHSVPGPDVTKTNPSLTGPTPNESSTHRVLDFTSTPPMESRLSSSVGCKVRTTQIQVSGDRVGVVSVSRPSASDTPSVGRARGRSDDSCPP